VDIYIYIYICIYIYILEQSLLFASFTDVLVNDLIVNVFVSVTFATSSGGSEGGIVIDMFEIARVIV
jgi:hypothetical protein